MTIDALPVNFMIAYLVKVSTNNRPIKNNKSPLDFKTTKFNTNKFQFLNKMLTTLMSKQKNSVYKISLRSALDKKIKMTVFQ